MRGTGAGEPPGLGFDHAAKAIPPQGALLLKVDPDLLHGLVGQGFAHDGLIGPCTSLLIGGSSMTGSSRAG